MLNGGPASILDNLSMTYEIITRYRGVSSAYVYNSPNVTNRNSALTDCEKYLERMGHY